MQTRWRDTGELPLHRCGTWESTRADTRAVDFVTLIASVAVPNPFGIIVSVAAFALQISCQVKSLRGTILNISMYTMLAQTQSILVPHSLILQLIMENLLAVPVMPHTPKSLEIIFKINVRHYEI